MKTIQTTESTLDDGELNYLFVEAIEESDDLWQRFQHKIDERQADILSRIFAKN